MAHSFQDFEAGIRHSLRVCDVATGKLQWRTGATGMLGISASWLVGAEALSAGGPVKSRPSTRDGWRT